MGKLKLLMISVFSLLLVGCQFQGEKSDQTSEQPDQATTLIMLDSEKQPELKELIKAGGEPNLFHYNLNGEVKELSLWQELYVADGVFETKELFKIKNPQTSGDILFNYAPVSADPDLKQTEPRQSDFVKTIKLGADVAKIILPEERFVRESRTDLITEETGDYLIFSELYAPKNSQKPTQLSDEFLRNPGKFAHDLAPGEKVYIYRLGIKKDN